MGRLRFVGIPVLVECRCPRCHGQYWLDLPVGHALLHPVSINAKTGLVRFDGLDWYPKMLRRCIQSRPAAGTPPLGRTPMDGQWILSTTSRRTSARPGTWNWSLSRRNAAPGVARVKLMMNHRLLTLMRSCMRETSNEAAAIALCRARLANDRELLRSVIEPA